MKWFVQSGVAAALGVLVSAAVVSPARAETYSFTNITHNNVADEAIGEAQLSLEVINVSSGIVDFRFSNAGPSASSITDVYFDDGPMTRSRGTTTYDGPLTSIVSLYDSGAGVDFSPGASPGNLPGGNTISFTATNGMTADSNNPTQPSGVNPGEWLTIRFAYAGTFDSLLNQLTAGLSGGGAGTLRVGIHVQGFAGGGSESFVNGPPVGPPPPPPPPPPGVPLPGVVWAGMALLGGTFVRRRWASVQAK